MGIGMFYNDTVTLFNRFCDPETEKEKYYPTLLEYVNLVERRGTETSKSGTDSVNAATLYIDHTNMPKPYMEPKQWEALSDDEKENYITFTPGEDFFIKGSCTGATESGQDYEWMKANFDGVYKVTQVDKFENIMPHFEVGGV